MKLAPKLNEIENGEKLMMDPVEYHVFYMGPTRILSLILLFQLGGKERVYFHFDGAKLLVYPNPATSHNFYGLNPWERDALIWLTKRKMIEINKDTMKELEELAYETVDKITESLRIKRIVKKSDERSEFQDKLVFYGSTFSLIVISSIIAFLYIIGYISWLISIILIPLVWFIFGMILIHYIISGEEESPEAKRVTQEFGAYTEELIKLIVKELPRKTDESEIIEILDKVISKGLPYVMAINEQLAFELIIKAYKIITQKQEEGILISGWLPTWLDPNKTRQHLGENPTLKRVLEHLVNIVNEISEGLGEGNLIQTLSTELIDSLYEE